MYLFHVVLGCSLLFVSAFEPSSARGQLPLVTTTVDPCVAVDMAAFQRILAIELGTSVQLAAQPPAAGRAAHVQIRCVPGGVELFLQDPITRKSMTRVLVAAGLAADKERMLALAVAEFVVASWIELAVVPEPVVEPVGPPPARADLDLARGVAADRARGASNAVRFSVVLSSTSWLAKERPAALGPGVRLSHRLAGALTWQLGADFGFGSESVESGHVEFSGVTGHGVVGLSGVEGIWEAGFALGARVGYLRSLGVPQRGSDVDSALATGATGGPVLLTTLVLHAGTFARVGIEIEAGYPVFPLRLTSGGEVVMAFDGPWLRGGLLIGVEF
ncbi:MAG: hypothetical protein OXU20_24585 [Myxococcales bacterium]|nr:hypothetical protein [Myxococcales bacterium]MDD9971939.1 hypothetical protein [Myxococcales bacterium]